MIERPLRQGDQVRERATLGGRVHEGTWTVAEHDRPHKVVLQIDGGRIEITYAFHPDGGGTLLRRDSSCRPHDFAGGASDPDGLEQRTSNQSEEALRRLKWLVERLVPLEHAKLASRRILEAVFAADFAAVDDGFWPDAGVHDPGMDFQGSAELRKGIERFLTAFPDFQFTILDQLAEADRVMVRYRGQGTHRAEMLGVPATGRRINYIGMLLLRMRDDRIGEFWANPDQLGLLKQLGAKVSVPGTVASPRSAPNTAVSS